jgi:glycyl-radical enzyme activating protein
MSSSHFKLGGEIVTMAVGTIFNIQRFSIHDGPGIRSTIFFKGCNLNCKWCHNPESKSFKKEIEFYPQRCIGCGACFKACLNCAHVTDESSVHYINRTKCRGCLLCTESCYANAIVGVGNTVDTDYILKEIMTDELYYRNSNGGVTFSGGECMLQIDFLAEILMKCKEKDIHTAVDTAGHLPWSNFERILSVTDLFLYDVKAAEALRHEQLTGVDNVLILQNLKMLSYVGKQIHVRIPYIVGYNEDQIEKIGEILKPLNIAKVEVLPYHKLGNSKYAALGIESEMLELEVPTEAMVEGAIAVLRSKGLNAERS